MKLQPLGKRALLKKIKMEEKSSSGIVLPDTVDKNEVNEGEILALGDQKKAKKLGLKLGDKVIYAYGREIKIADEEMVLVDFDEISAIVK